MKLAPLFFVLFSTAVACAPETTTGPNVPASTPCSADECAKVPEPPIAPMACGVGHESEIGTTCGRGANGQCSKMLTCGGKRPG